MKIMTLLAGVSVLALSACGHHHVNAEMDIPAPKTKRAALKMMNENVAELKQAVAAKDTARINYLIEAMDEAEDKLEEELDALEDSSEAVAEAAARGDYVSANAGLAQVDKDLAAVNARYSSAKPKKAMHKAKKEVKAVEAPPAPAKQ